MEPTHKVSRDNDRTMEVPHHEQGVVEPLKQAAE
jgi:hypothetical protein